MMRITIGIMKKLGFVRETMRANPFDTFNWAPFQTHYPFNHMKFLFRKKDRKVVLQTDRTIYDCSTLSRLLASVFFAGINYGHKQKIAEFKKVMDIKD